MNGPDIRKMRKELLKCSLQQLARKIGVTLVTVHNWESGKTKPSPLAMDKLKMVLGDINQELGEKSPLNNDFFYSGFDSIQTYAGEKWCLPQQLALPLKIT